MLSPTKENDPCDDDNEVPWTDDAIRWTTQENEALQQSDDENDMMDPFQDATPVELVTHRFPMHHNQTVKESEGDKAVISVVLEGFKEDSDAIWKSTGLTLWRASFRMCQYILDHADDEEWKGKKRILELGAGLGLCGILAHLRLSTSQVCLTDGDTDALVYLRKNILRNQKTKSSNDDDSACISCQQLLWGAESSRTFLQKQQTWLEQHNYEAEKKVDDDTKNDEAPPSPLFDVIMASDIIYAPSIIVPLWETVSTLLCRDGGIFVLAFCKRDVPVTIHDVLTSATEHGFSHDMIEHDEENGIYVYTFRFA